MQNLTEFEKQQLNNVRQLLATLKVPNHPKSAKISEELKDGKYSQNESEEKTTQLYRDY